MCIFISCLLMGIFMLFAASMAMSDNLGGIPVENTWGDFWGALVCVGIAAIFSFLIA